MDKRYAYKGSREGKGRRNGRPSFYEHVNVVSAPIQASVE